MEDIFFKRNMKLEYFWIVSLFLQWCNDFFVFIGLNITKKLLASIQRALCVHIVFSSNIKLKYEYRITNKHDGYTIYNIFLIFI